MTISIKAYSPEGLSITKSFINEHAADCWMEAMRGIYGRFVAFDISTRMAGGSL
jgi:hypothetical protein